MVDQTPLAEVIAWELSLVGEAVNLFTSRGLVVFTSGTRAEQDGWLFITSLIHPAELTMVIDKLRDVVDQQERFMRLYGVPVPRFPFASPDCYSPDARSELWLTVYATLSATISQWQEWQTAVLRAFDQVVADVEMSDVSNQAGQ